MARRLGWMILAVWALLLPLASAARAEVSPEVMSLSRALQMDKVMVVLREEGLASSADLMTDGPDGPGAALWRDSVSRIYDVSAMEAEFETAMDRSLQALPDIAPAATEFFTSDLGQRIVQLELDARRALQDEDVQATAEQAYDDMAKDNPARHDLIGRFVAANDLVESNVMGGLNANLAFLRGLAAAGGAGIDLSEADMLEQVWSSEPEMRTETTAWVHAFLTLAYQPLSDAELQSYVDFSQSRDGKALNAALFQAFDTMFERLSFDLGRAYGMQLQGDDI